MPRMCESDLLQAILFGSFGPLLASCCLSLGHGASHHSLVRNGNLRKGHLESARKQFLVVDYNKNQRIANERN